MRVAIIILNWNGEALLRRFLPAVVNNSPEATIHVIDNNSSDGSMRYITENFSEVNQILLNQNHGYARGYNEGLKEIDADLVCLLNNDIKVQSGWMPPVIDHFIKNENTVIAQPHLMDLNNPNKFEYAGAAGGYIDRLGYPYCRGRIFKELEEDDGQFDTDKKIFWASGACFFIRLQEFRSLGGFDINFFAHQEEIDLCWRAFNEGFETMSISTSKVYHLGGGTLRPSYQKSFLNFRNSLFLLYKNLPEKVFFRIFERMIWDGVAVFYFLIKLEFRSAVAVLHAHFSFYFHLFTKKIIRKKNVKKNKYFKLKSLPIQHFLHNKSKYFQL